MKTVKERLIAYLDYKGISNRRFQQEIGASNAYVCNLIGKPSRQMTYKIHERFPDLSIDWLMNGTGEMIDTSIDLSTCVQTIDNSNMMTNAKNVVSGVSHGNGVVEHHGTSEDDKRQIEELLQSIKRKDEQIKSLLASIQCKDEQLSKKDEQITKFVDLIVKLRAEN